MADERKNTGIMLREGKNRSFSLAGKTSKMKE